MVDLDLDAWSQAAPIDKGPIGGAHLVTDDKHIPSLFDDGMTATG